MILLGSALAAVLLPLLPYAWELRALRTLSTAALGTLMSFEPAVAALIGLLLGQSAGVLQCAGIACVTAAGLEAVYWGNRLPADSGSPPEETPGVREPVAVVAPGPAEAPSGK